MNSLHKKSFPEVLTEVTKQVPGLNLPGIREIHKTRNAIQHSGLLIAKSQAGRYFSLTKQLLNSTCKSIFNINWNQVSLSSLIIDDDVRKLYHSAEQSFVSKKYKESSKFLIMAFETAKRLRQQSQVGSMITFTRITAELTELEKKDSKLFEYAEKIEQELEVLKLSLDYSKWLGYRRELGNVNPIDFLYNSDKNSLINEEKMGLFTEDNETVRLWTIRNLDFVLETILMWESSILNLIGEND